jgi:hypothetical protein
MKSFSSNGAQINPSKTLAHPTMEANTLIISSVALE